MPVSNAHLSENTRVWDGKAFHMMPNEKAVKEEKAGRVQIAKGLQAKDLKRADQFKKKPGRRKKKQTYETREMRAADVASKEVPDDGEENADPVSKG